MEILKSIQSIFNASDCIKLRENSAYGFSIYRLSSPKHKCQLIFTVGLSNHKQNTNQKHKDFEFVELYFCLPDYWRIDDHIYLVDYLEKIAQIPKKNQTWFGPGDTIPTAKTPVALSDKLRQAYFILSEPLLLKNELTKVKTEHKNIRFFAIIPIFDTEFDYKMRNSAKVLIAKMQYKNVNELLDYYRTPVARKRILGLF
jgi:hypothetical protein